MSRFTVIRDTREKEDQGWWFAETNYCTGTLQEKLDTGDYSLQGYEDKLCIERKGSISEFANNLVEKRFTDVLDRMKGFPHKYIILEFDLENILCFPEKSGIPKYRWKTLKVTPNFLLKRVADIQVKYNIPIIFCGNKDGAQAMVLSIFKRVIEQYG